MNKLTIVSPLLLMLALIIGAIGCVVEEETATPTLTPATTKESAPDDATKMPEVVIPLTVPGFSLVEKSERVLMPALGEEYYAYSFFEAKANSDFWDKVGNLEVRVYLFENEASSEAGFDALTAGGTSSTEIQVNDARAILTYDEYFGEAAAIQKQGRLVILSDSIPPFEWPLPDPSTYDKQALQEAAIEGLRAIRLTAMPTVTPTPTQLPSTPTPTPTAVSISIGLCGKRIPLKVEVYIAGEMMHLNGPQWLIKGEIVNGTDKAVWNVKVLSTATVEAGGVKSVYAGFTGGTIPPGASSTFWSQFPDVRKEDVCTSFTSHVASYDALDTYASPEVVFDDVALERDYNYPRLTGYLHPAPDDYANTLIHVVFEDENGVYVASDEGHASEVLRDGVPWGYFTLYSTPDVEREEVSCYRLFVTYR